MHVTFNGNTFTIPASKHGLYHASALGKAWAAVGGLKDALTHWLDTLDETQRQCVSVFPEIGLYGGVWVDKRGLLAFAAYCSSELEAALSSEFRKTS